MATITGATRVYGILADPIAQVRTPELFNALLEAKGVDGVLVPMHVAADDLASLWDGLRRMKSLGGLVVTVPHKSAILDLCDEVGEAARAIGAANVVRREADGRMVCDMYDGKGFVEGLRTEGRDPAGKHALLAGAGGAASAIAFALADAGVASLTVANRTPAKADALVARLREVFADGVFESGPAVAGDHDLIVNGTSLGMRAEDPLPVDLSAARAGTIVAEVIMKPEITPLLAAAREAGLEIHGGVHMLQAQLRLLAKFVGALSD